MAWALDRIFQELPVPSGEGLGLLSESGKGHAEVHWCRREFLARRDTIGAEPLLGLVLIVKRVDRELEGGEEASGSLCFFDPAASGDDGGEHVTMFGATLEPISGCLKFAIIRLKVEIALGAISRGEACPATGADRHRLQQRRGAEGEIRTR